MSVTQTVEIPASRRLTIDVPREVPEGAVILTFTPAAAKKPTDQRSVEQSADTDECPFCAEHGGDICDPVTGEELFNAETVAAIEEGRAMMRGEIPAKWYTSTDEMWEDLMRDDPDDDLED